MFAIPLPKCSLGVFPTPLVELKNLSRHLGIPRLWMKRDDLTGLALGGNKVRKLEYLLGEAVAHNCDTVITAGAAQSNHCRQTAAAAASLGLSCHLALGGSPPENVTGNLLLDELFGAHIHWSGDFRKGELLPEIERGLRAEGRNPAVIPYGGSSPAGAAGFVAATFEIEAQLAAFGATSGTIVFASSSGGTHAGLTVGTSLAEADFEILGIQIDKGEAGEGDFAEHVANLANGTAALLKQPGHYSPDDIRLSRDYCGDGYGVVGDLEREAIRLVARKEGILLDPVYTGRAFGALLDLVARGEFRGTENLIFWHTGGAPALFAYADTLRGL